MIITFLEHKSLQEKLITFGKKAYPKFGNVVILADIWKTIKWGDWPLPIIEQLS